MEISIVSTRQFMVRLFGDRSFYYDLLRIALPMLLQNVIMSSLNMVGVVMVGQLGETSVAAVGLANQVFFLLNLVLFGITSGSAIFTAQLWGKRNIASIRKVLGLALLLGGSAGLIFTLLAEIIPDRILSIYTTDPAVIQLGANYLRIFGPAFLLVSITFCYAAILRSVGEVRLPVFVSTTILFLNMGMSFWMIFGGFGLPPMGVIGAAWAGLIARILECAALLILTYAKRLPPAAKLSEMFGFNLSFAVAVLKPVLPVALNEFLWSMGITTYSVIYARIGTHAIAAMNIAASIDNLAMVAFFSTAGACAVLVGNLIGSGDTERAYNYGGWCLRLVLFLGLGVGVVLYGFNPTVLRLYKVSPSVINDAHLVLNVIALLIWLRASNAVVFLGILRSGGDTRFALLLDGVIIWVVGVPMAALAAFVFHLPIYFVYLAAMTEEFTKWSLAIWRYVSRRWIHDLTTTV